MTKRIRTKSKRTKKKTQRIDNNKLNFFKQPQKQKHKKNNTS